MNSKIWHLVYTKPRQEHVAKENLLRQNYEIYLPMAWQKRRRAMQYQLTKEPLFPHYLFIHLSNQVDNWGPIRSTRGVINLVRFGNITPFVPNNLISFLQEQENREPKISLAPEFKPGEKVRIINGAFIGYDAIFEATNSKQRVCVLLDIVGKHSRIQLSPEMLQGLE